MASAGRDISVSGAGHAGTASWWPGTKPPALTIAAMRRDVKAPWPGVRPCPTGQGAGASRACSRRARERPAGADRGSSCHGFRDAKILPRHAGYVLRDLSLSAGYRRRHRPSRGIRGRKLRDTCPVWLMFAVPVRGSRGCLRSASSRHAPLRRRRGLLHLPCAGPQLSDRLLAAIRRGRERSSSLRYVHRVALRECAVTVGDDHRRAAAALVALDRAGEGHRAFRIKA